MLIFEFFLYQQKTEAFSGFKFFYSCTKRCQKLFIYRDNSQRVFSKDGSCLLTWEKLSQGTQSLGVSSEWYRGTKSWLITSTSFIKVMTFWNFFWKKKSHFVIFLEASLHLQERRELNNCPNDTNENALERGSLGASFELYDGCSSRLETVLSSFKAYPLWIFSTLIMSSLFFY